MRRVVSLALVAVLSACQDGAPRESDTAAGTESSPSGEAGAAAPPAARGGAGEEGAAPAGRGSTESAGELPVVDPVPYQIFDETREPEAPPRVTLHMLIDTRASRDELRQTLSDAIDEQTAADASLVAVRAIGYRPQQIEAAEFQMVPFVWAEWLPTEGWYLATDRSRDSLHGLYFYHGVAPEW